MRATMKILKTILFASTIVCAVAQANDDNAGSGTVAEMINVEHYVYIRLEKDGVMQTPEYQACFGRIDLTAAEFLPPR